jgi:hypothetical protein
LPKRSQLPVSGTIGTLLRVTFTLPGAAMPREPLFGRS